MELISSTFPVVAQAADNQQLILQILNVSGFLIAMVFNGASQAVMPYSLSDITNQWDARIDPAGYAFSIWGLIYSLLGVFTVY
jgi:translocator protein